MINGFLFYLEPGFIFSSVELAGAALSGVL